MKTRVLFSDNSTITDYTTELNRWDSNTKAPTIVAAEDAIYVGNYLPFNHFYLEIGDTANAQASSVDVNLWDGTNWKDVAEVIDETASTGVTLAQSGWITWVTDRDNSWSREDTNHNGATVPGLSTVDIYDRYWIRLEFSADLTASVDLKYLGHKFSDDTDLGAEFPELDRSVIRDSFTVGLSDFNELHVRAADLLIQDLRRSNIIWGKGQILDRYDFKLASVAKVAEMIFRTLGDDYIDQRDDARVLYKIRLASGIATIDKNLDADIQPGENYVRSVYARR